MELKGVKLQTTWNDAAIRINSNTQKIGMELDKLRAATYKNKGYFASAESLASTYPTGSVGSKAYVGTSYPYDIYIWSEEANAWLYSGYKGGEEEVPLGDYYTKEETQDVVEGFHIFLTQEAYDALETKEDKLYFCYEE